MVNRILCIVAVALLWFVVPPSVHAQRGKDGALTLNGGTTVVNEFTALTANANAGTTILTVANSNLNTNGRFANALAPGDLVMVIQMQGATIDGANNANFGQVLNYNNCGHYDLAEVASVPSGTSIELCCGLEFNYTSTGRVQVVRIPRYTTLTVNAGANLTTDTWNGISGGILAVEVEGQSTINGAVDANARGFRGGALENDNSPFTITTFRSANSVDGGEKGESIAGFQADYNAVGGRYGRGAPANGGGGGNAHNAGGGGGANGGDPALWNGLGNPNLAVANWVQAWNLEAANFANNTSSGGGRGGYSYSANNGNALLTPPGNGAWGGDNRDNIGGYGGRPLDYTQQDRLFFGGGGGAGDQNNSAGGAGGRGGGIVYFLSYGTVGGAGTITANGANGANTVGGGNDGPGGGGGGGAIWMDVTGLVSGINLTANGGNGGSQFIGNNEAEGPGGGGGGGFISTFNSTAAATTNGGTNGTSSSQAVTEFIPNGATQGGAGTPNAPHPSYTLQTTPDSICAGQTANLTAAILGNPGLTVTPTIVWQDAPTCGNVLGTGANFTTPILFDTITFWVGICPGTYRVPVTVIVYPTPTPVISGPVNVCIGGTFTYSTPNQAGHTYTWAAVGGTIASGQGTNTVDITWGAGATGSVSVTQTSPQGCDTTVTLNVTPTALPTPVIVGPTTHCPVSTTPVAYSVTNTAGNTYTWTASNGTVASGQGSSAITVQWGATGPGTLSVTETTPAGCTASASINISFFPTPDAAIAGPVAVCQLATGTIFSAAAQAGATFTWTVSGGTIVSGAGTNSIVVDWGTAGAGSVTLTVASAPGCTDTQVFPVTINPTPTPVITGQVNVCSGSTLTYSTPNLPGNAYIWSAVGGTIVNGQGTNSVDITWSAAPTGSVSVTQISLQGCDTTVTLNVIPSSLPTPTIVGPTTHCPVNPAPVPYSVANTPGNTYTWTATNGTVVTGQGTSNITVLWGATGPGTLTVTESTATGCTGTATINITFFATPIAAFTGLDSLCELSTGVAYTGTAQPGATFTWSVTGGSIVSGAGTSAIVVDWGAAGTGSVTLTVGTGSACTVTQVLPVDLNPNPTPVIAGPGGICAQSAGVGYSVANTAGSSFTWSVVGGSIISGAGTNAIVVDWGTNGAGSVEVTEVNSFGCTTTATFPVTIFPLPTPNIIGPLFVCELTGAHPYSTPNNIGSTYSWTISGGTITSGANTSTIVVDWGANGAGALTVTETDLNGCSTTATFSVSILDKPIPVITGPNSVCSGDGGFVYATSATAASTYSWTANGGAITSGQGTNSITVTWGASGTGSVSVTETNAVGCDSLVTFVVDILPTPTTNVTGPIEICEGNEAIYSTPNVPGNTYNWTVAGGSILSGTGTNNIQVAWGNAGNGTVTLTETHPQGCDSVFVLPVTIRPRPNPMISGPLQVCEFDGPFTYSTGTAGPTYNWQVTGGTILNGQGTNSISVAWGNTGTGSIDLLETNGFGCDSSNSITVTILPKPTPTITGPTTVCERTDDHVYTAPNVPGSSYNWGITGGWVVSGQGTPTLTVNWGNNGTGVLSLQEINGVGCDSTITLNVSIVPRPTPNFTGEPSVCAGATGITYSLPPVAGASYTWTVTNGTIVGGQGTAAISVDWPQAGTGSVDLAIENASGCDSSFTLPITIAPLPEGVMLPDTARGCAPLGVEFSPAVSANTVGVNWNFGDGGTSTGTVASHVFQTAGTYSVTGTLVSDQGCTADLTGFVEVYPSPTAGFEVGTQSGDPVLQMPFDSLFVINTSVGADTFTWNFGDGTIDFGPHPVHIYQTPGEYVVRLLVGNEFGCLDSIQRTVTVESEIIWYIPNAFTPNGDNVNDEFSIVSYNLVDFQIMIFDRWGALIYESFDPNFSWNGDFRGQPSQEGVYTAVIEGATASGIRQKTVRTVTIYR